MSLHLNQLSISLEQTVASAWLPYKLIHPNFVYLLYWLPPNLLPPRVDPHQLKRSPLNQLEGLSLGICAGFYSISVSNCLAAHVEERLTELSIVSWRLARLP
jgi:hypothetical protein